ncbi:hypothetical protein B0H17DRAFT_1218497 [Mycena rosella]|uniref:Uncharacterized protein n=1 Tax=Mycena rosella TaxID=1033263 RepID=A0AAD7BP12_MYCRO|nr:hypothetical protein B0H17DRAFT_1218497 [Mycena rosella]
MSNRITVVDPLFHDDYSSFPILEVHPDVSPNGLTASQYLRMCQPDACRSCRILNRRCTFVSWGASCGECLVTLCEDCDFTSRHKFVVAMHQYRNSLILSGGPDLMNMIRQFYADLRLLFLLFSARLGSDEKVQIAGITNIVNTLVDSPALTALALLTVSLRAPTHLNRLINERIRELWEFSYSPE